MGLELHIKQTLGSQLWNYSVKHYIKGKFQLEFPTSSSRNMAYGELIRSGEFNPRKVGIYIIRFDPFYGRDIRN